jgi:endoglucanase
VVGRDGDADTAGTSSGKPAGGGAAARFLDRYLTDGGRVVRRDQGGDTVSEGQAYALMVLAATGDRRRFDRVWGWTQRNLQRPDGLFAWRWDAGRVRDPSPATDADVDIAGALATGAARFDDPVLAEEARRVAEAVLDHETAEVAGRTVLVAGPWAREGAVVNPSYLAGCGGPDLAAVAGTRWSAVVAAGVDAVADLAGGGLPPDWAVGDAAGLRPVAGPDDRSGPGRYGLDAARIPARVAACPGGQQVAAGLWQRLRSLDEGGAALASALDGRRLSGDVNPVGLIGAAGAARAAGDDDAAERLFARAAELERRHTTYYGAAWLALGETMLGLGRTAGAAEPAESAGSTAPRIRLAARGTAAVIQQPQPTEATTTVATTAPPTTLTPATDPPPTTAPTTATESPSSQTSTTAPASSDTTGTSPGSPALAGGAPSTSVAPGGQQAETGDLSAAGDPAAQATTVSGTGRDDPAEPARRRTGGIALSGLAATLALGAALGLRERTIGLRRARRA